MSRWVTGAIDGALSIGFFGAVGVAIGYTITSRFDIATWALLWATIFQRAIGTGSLR